MRSQLEDSKAGGWKDLEIGLLTDLLFEVGCQLGASDLSTWPPHAISLPGPVSRSHSMVAGFEPAKHEIAYYCLVSYLALHAFYSTRWSPSPVQCQGGKIDSTS